MELLQQPPKSLPMHILAAELWDMFQNQDGIDCGYHRTGGLYCVLREEDLPMLDAQEKTFKKHNLPIERLNKEQVKEKYHIFVTMLLLLISVRCQDILIL